MALVVLSDIMPGAVGEKVGRTDRKVRHSLYLVMSNATAIVGNSSVAIRECSFLGVPAVNVGSRQQGRERGQNVMDVDHDRKAIAGAIAEHRRRGKPPSDRLYGDGKAGGGKQK